MVDTDLGQSGSSANWRAGFKQLAEEVAHGRIGGIFALEVSRLARSSADWYRLLELCRLADVVIVDEQNVYAPCDYGDRLLLGLQGTMSEAEQHWMRLRLEGGRLRARAGITWSSERDEAPAWQGASEQPPEHTRRYVRRQHSEQRRQAGWIVPRSDQVISARALSKARRGEYRINTPAGYLWDEEQCRMVIDPDEAVVRAVRLIFERFRLDGSAYAVTRYFAGAGWCTTAQVERWRVGNVGQSLGAR